MVSINMRDFILTSVQPIEEKLQCVSQSGKMDKMGLIRSAGSTASVRRWEARLSGKHIYGRHLFRTLTYFFFLDFFNVLSAGERTNPVY